MTETNGPNGVKHKLSVEHRLTTLETHINTIKDNHLPHLDKKVESVSKKLSALIWLFVTTLVALIANLVLRLITLIT